MARFEGTETAPGTYSPLITIEIVLSTPDEEPALVRALALIDSSADGSVVPSEIVGVAGIEFGDLQPGPKGIGAGGEFEVRKVLGSLSWDGEVFLDDELMVTQPGTLRGPLLGRADFFKTFGAEFDWSKEPPRFHVERRRIQSR